MCTISDKIKFCTCKASSTNQLQNYWVLYRRNKDKNIMIVGEAKLPNFNPNFKLNYDVVATRLQEEDAFDFDTPFKNNDLLEVVFYNHDYDKRMEFGFKFKKGVWVKEGICDFYTSGHCDVVRFGKIKK